LAPGLFGEDKLDTVDAGSTTGYGRIDNGSGILNGDTPLESVRCVMGDGPVVVSLRLNEEVCRPNLVIRNVGLREGFANRGNVIDDSSTSRIGGIGSCLNTDIDYGKVGSRSSCPHCGNGNRNVRPTLFGILCNRIGHRQCGGSC
jgi:hypothetical protein